MGYGFDEKRKQPASHIAAILGNNELNLTAVCEIDEKLKKKYIKNYNDKNEIFNDHLELIKKIKNGEVDCDILTIATPEKTHEKIILDILNILENFKKSLIIFCEKPLALNLESGLKIKEKIKNDNIKIVVNHSRRWSKAWKEAFDLKKEIGEIKNASIYFSTSPENKEIVQIRDGIHIADIMSWFKIEKTTKINRLKTDYFIYDFYMWGTKGKIEILEFGEKLNFYKIKKSQRFEGFNDLELHISKKFEESMMENTYFELVEFFKRDKTLSTNIDDGVSALEVFEKYVYDKNISKL